MDVLIIKKGKKAQMELIFDCVMPSECLKILDCLWSEEADDILCGLGCTVTYEYSVEGFNGRNRYARESVIYIAMPECSETFNSEEMEVDMSMQLEEDRKVLEELKTYILKKTGLGEEKTDTAIVTKVIDD